MWRKVKKFNSTNEKRSTGGARQMQQLCLPQEECYILKGTVSRDFLPLVFSIKVFLLVPKDMPIKDFNFFANIRKVIQLLRCIASVNNTSEAGIAGVVETGEKFLTGVVDTGKLCFYCFRVLCRCQRRR
jgi:hypothetical protein